MPKIDDSASAKWEYREHTRVKHILLRKYLSAWIPILGNSNPLICYVDGFAGRGEYAGGELGSPIMAVKVADRLSKHFDNLTCYFVEKDDENFANLQEVLAREMPTIQNREKILVELRHTDFASFVSELLSGTQSSGKVPSFFFIDPFGFTGIPFSTVAKILANPRTEIFFTFMVRDIRRFLGLRELEEDFTNLFGTDHWKEIVRSSNEPEVDLIELYRLQLHEGAAVQYSWPFRICATEKLQTLYYLIHASNSFKGHSIMKDIMFNQGKPGDFAYLGPRDLAARSQMRLFDINSTESLKDHLLKRFGGKQISYDQIQREVCVPWQSEPPYVDRQYRAALKQLETEEKISIRRVTSKTQQGLTGQDVIAFLPKTLGTGLAPASQVIKPRVHYETYNSLDGDKRLLVSRVNDGSIISRFDKTQTPSTETDVVCPHFLELKWAYGCPFDCAWCYLKGTFRHRPDGTKPAFKDPAKIALHVKTFLEEAEFPEILNTGELADSLMGESLCQPFSESIIRMFEAQRKHKVLFVTKSDNIQHLLEISPHNQAIISFSLNAIDVANQWEKGAPSVDRRIEAGRKLAQAGYQIRVRIDPIVPVSDWRAHYFHLIDQVFANFIPTRITLGSLRGLQSTINQSKDRTWLPYLAERSNWGKKVDFKVRYQVYFAIMRYLKDNHHCQDVALCKETVQMWRELDMDYRSIRCNCTW